MNVNCIVSRDIKLSEPTKKIFLSAPLAYNNALAHSMRVNVYNDDGTAADLSGVGVTGVFLRADNKTVNPINGTTVESASGVKNIAEIILPASCYIVPGRYTFTMNLTANGSTRTVLWVEGHVERNTSEEIIDPGTPVGNIEQAIGSANSAASAANAAASDANAAAETATQAAAAAQEVADNVEGEVDELRSALNEISYLYTPVNYGVISAADATYPTDKAQYITVTDGADESEVLVSNSSGVNTWIMFPLSDLAYGTRTGYTVRLYAENLAASSAPSINYRVNPGVSVGYVQWYLTQQEDGSYLYTIDDLFARYDHSAFGDLYIGISMRYNQRTEATLKVVVNILGDEEKRLISNSGISGLEMSNLGTDLQKEILEGNQYPTLYAGEQISTFNKGVAIGDSLTAGVFNTHDSYVTKQAFSYPAKLSQLTGIDMTNLGNGGFTSAQWYAAHASEDLSGYQFAIIQLGVNDALQNSGWTQESETAFTNIINKLLNENNGIFVFVSTIIPATSYSGTSFNSVSNGIRTLIETLNNTHVILLDMALYGNTKTKTAYNNGHLSALGYERLALDYKSYISYVIEQNTLLFRNIQFIGTTDVYP